MEFPKEDKALGNHESDHECNVLFMLEGIASFWGATILSGHPARVEAYALRDKSLEERSFKSKCKYFCPPMWSEGMLFNLVGLENYPSPLFVYLN